MAEYNHIIAAVDFSESAQTVVARAKSLADTNDAKLTLIHVVEPMSVAFGGDIPVDLTEIQREIDIQTQEQIKSLCDQFSLSIDQHQILTGQPASEIHRFAEENNVDLIVIGSHGRKGLSLLLGSTANSVLHGASCDVLAVRVYN